MPSERSSKRQRELLNFVDGFIQGHGYGPSYREIMRALGYKSVSTVAVHIDGLISKGYLLKRDNSARSLEVVTTHLDDMPTRKGPTPAQEKWIINAITSRFDALDKIHSQNTLDELYVLIGSLKILGIDGAHVAMKTRLIDYLKNHNINK
jgi:SOS-response transcriptional repressor LexA